MVPAAYGFTADAMPTMELVNAVKDMVLFCKESGLKLIATVCDQGSTNYACINELRNESKRTFAKMDKQKKEEMGIEKG